MIRRQTAAAMQRTLRVMGRPILRMDMSRSRRYPTRSEAAGRYEAEDKCHLEVSEVGRSFHGLKAEVNYSAPPGGNPKALRPPWVAWPVSRYAG